MKKYLAEFIGTAVLVIFGCGSAVAANTLIGNAGIGGGVPLSLSTLLIAFAFGLVIVAMAYYIGGISGCHINPAVSLAMFITKKLSAIDFAGYLVAQFLGGIAGAGVLAFVFGGTSSGLGSNGFGESSAIGATMIQALVVEVILTFVFVSTILGVTSKVENASVSGLVIGLTLTLVHIFGIPFTGTSVNPARSFGPALITGGVPLTQVWLFILAPLVGGALAAVVWLLFNKKKAEEK
ncbi:MAG: MIP family channel protein [Oscillospiraceae bacterium]